MLGPINTQTELYDYAVVTDSHNVSLKVFARDVHDFKHKYQDDVIDFCRHAGFSSRYNFPMESPQPRACKYYGDESQGDLFYEPRVVVN